MFKRSVSALFVGMMLAAALSAAVEPRFRPAAAGAIPGEYIVVLADGVAGDPLVPGSSGPPVAEVARRLAARYGGTVERSYEHALQGFAARLSEEAARRLAADPAVRLVEQNATVEVSTIDSCDPTFQSGQPGAVVENDNPLLRNTLAWPQDIACADPDPIKRTGDPDQTDGIQCRDNWGLDLIDGNRNAKYSYASATGAGVHVYLIDLGINAAHQEFRNLATSAPDDTRVKRGFNAAARDSDPDSTKNDVRDCVGNSHGTHVAAIAAGNTFGVAKRAWLHPVKFDDACNGRTGSRNTVINAVDWILRNHNQHPEHMGPGVVNFSGGNGSDASFRDGVMALWVRRLLMAGISFVQSAGNQDNRNTATGAPQNACLNTLAKNPELRDGVIVAGGVDETLQSNGTKAYHRWVRETADPSYPICTGQHKDCGSNFNSCVDIWAPAAHIVSAARTDATAACRLSGTSMAAPHVTGAVALLLARFPQASPSTVKEALAAAARPNILQAGTIGDSPNRLLHIGFPASGPPVAGDGWFVVAPGTQLVIFKDELLRGGLDWDGQALQLSQIGLLDPDHGQLVDGGDRLTYTPHGGFTGMDSFTYTVSDGNGGTDTATVRIQVEILPQAPVAHDDCYATPANTELALGSHIVPAFLDNDVDPDADFASFAIVQQPGSGQVGQLNHPSDGYVYRPNLGFSGTDSFRYIVRDSYHHQSTATVTVHVGGGSCPVDNQPPVPQDDAFSTAYNTSRSFFASTLLANDTDPDGDALSFDGLLTLPANGYLSVDGIGPEDIIYRYHPNPGFVGTDSFVYQVRDARGAVASATVRFTVTNQGFGGNPDHFVTTVDGLLRVLASQLTANDSPGAVFVNAGNPRNGDLVIGGIGPEDIVYDFYPTPGFTGEAGFDYNISPDGNPPYTLVSVTIQVNDGPPVAGFAVSCAGTVCSFDASRSSDDVGIDSYAWTFGDGTTGSGKTVSHTFSPGLYPVTLTVTDSAGLTASDDEVVTAQVADPLPVANFTWSCTQRNCSFDGRSSTDNDAIVSYFWEFGDGTTGSGATASRVYAAGGTYQVKLTVTDTANQQGQKTLPVPVNRPPSAVNDTAFTDRDTPVNVNVLANDSDPDGNPLTVTSWGQGGHGTVIKNPDGTLRYTPAAGYTGPDSFPYTVSDGRGDVATATVSITVRLPNNPPDARDDGWYTWKGIATNIPYANLLGNDYDPNGDALTVTNINTAGLTGTLNCGASPTYCVYTPPSWFVGTTSFTYAASDGKGGLDTATVRIKVGVTNSVPAPQNDFMETQRGVALPFTMAMLLANDTDADGDVLSVQSVTRLPLTGFGTVTCTTPVYNCTYTPAAGFTGVDRVAYRVTDGSNIADASILFLVKPGSTPVLDAREDQIFTTTNPTYISHTRMLSNDYDPEGGALTIVGFDAAGLAGTLDCTSYPGGCYYYRGTSDPTRFRYTVRDPQGNLDTTTVTLKPGNWSFNTVPQPAPDQLSARRNTPLQFTIFDLLRNDLDLDNDQLDIMGLWYTQYGRISCSAPTYTCTYTPNANFTGVDTFTYTPNDGTNSASATVTINVTP